MVSEKEMEDQIAAHPERFLGERQLKLIARQFRIGSYRFDLLFEDRHGGKLIVELQRGTLDREHTYKILDYYDEYRERHPAEFIDVMVIANQIPVERKKRLQALGVEYRELSEHLFASVRDVPITIESQRLQQDDVVSKLTGSPDEDQLAHRNPSDRHVPFLSLGASAFVVAARIAIQKALAEVRRSEYWKLGGDSSLTAELIQATEAIERIAGNGMKAQIWMERPKQGAGACKFEIAGKMSTLSVSESMDLRERIARSIRTHIERRGRPEGVIPSDGSTVVRCRLSVPSIIASEDDTSESALSYTREIKKIVEFILFLDRALSDWNTSDVPLTSSAS